MTYPKPLPRPFTDEDTRMWFLIFHYALQGDDVVKILSAGMAHRPSPTLTYNTIPFIVDGEERRLEISDLGEHYDERPATRGWPMGKHSVKYSVEGLFEFIATFDTTQNKYHQDKFSDTMLKLELGVTDDDKIEEIQHHMSVWKLMAPFPIA